MAPTDRNTEGVPPQHALMGVAPATLRSVLVMGTPLTQGSHSSVTEDGKIGLDIRTLRKPPFMEVSQQTPVTRSS